MANVKEFNRQWRNKYPEKVKKMEKQWIKNIKNHPESMKEYYKAIREGNKKYNKRYERTNNKYKNDMKYKINRRISSLIWYSLKGNKNGRHWEDLVGYTLKDLVKRLKKTIPKDYTWQDYLEGKLHIDHIIPISAYNFNQIGQIDFQRCWALSNLQLLSAKENLIKSNKLTKPFQPCLKLGV